MIQTDKYLGPLCVPVKRMRTNWYNWSIYKYYFVHVPNS